MKTTRMESDFPGLLQDFFCQHMMAERGLSAQTVASYRDTFRLLLQFAQERLGILPSNLKLCDFDAELILAFLDHLEQVRGVGIRTRNTRLAAVRSFMRYAAGRVPQYLGVVQSVLAVPTKRFDRPAVEFLSRQEVEAIINAPNTQLWSGRRDHCLFVTLYNTGARVSEITILKVGDLRLAQSPSVHLNGKGRKYRTMPLWKRTARVIKRWLKEVDPAPTSPLFPNRFGQIMTRSGVEKRLKLAVQKAVKKHPSLCDRRISPHTFRHTTAMHLLQANVDITVIALWLGHESPATAHHYVEADLTMKQRALDKVNAPLTRASKYRPSDRLLAFLEAL